MQNTSVKKGKKRTTTPLVKDRLAGGPSHYPFMTNKSISQFDTLNYPTERLDGESDSNREQM